MDLKFIKKTYKIFDEIDFKECDDCNNKCCYFPWLLKEEYCKHLKNFGKTVKEINSIAFVIHETKCKFAKNKRCHVYKDRPLDCRLFPLDIIEEGGKYYWCIFTTCLKHKTIRERLVPLINKIEKLISPEIFDQYKKQIKITKKIYLPYKLGQYEKIKLLNIKYEQ